MPTFSAFLVTVDDPARTPRAAERDRLRMLKRMRQAAALCVEYAIPVEDVAAILYDECEPGSLAIVVPHFVCPELA